MLRIFKGLNNKNVKYSDIINLYRNLYISGENSMYKFTRNRLVFIILRIIFGFLHINQSINKW